MNNTYFGLLILMLSASCGSNEPVTNTEKNTPSKVQEVSQEDRSANALTFINDYIEFSNDPNSSYSIHDWVKLSDLATKDFEDELQNIMDKAYKEDPEMGLGFDPIFDAQDFPSDGFELDAFDEQSNYLIVKGKDMPELIVTMKVKKENGKWLVDGCGIVNISEKERSPR